jgi:DNA replication protein DnaC
MNESLRTRLRQLRLSGLAQALDVRLQEAAGHGLNHLEFLELILQDEINVRQQRLLARRIKTAAFRETRTLDDFDFSFNPSIKRKPIYELATGQFIRDTRDVLFIGPPGVGKSHLVQAIGHQAIKSGFLVLYRSIFDMVRELKDEDDLSARSKPLARYLKPDLLIIDDMGLKQLPAQAGEYLFEIIMRRHENRSTMMTSNRPIEEWGKLVGDVPAATAILDRFLQHAEIIHIAGKSYRLKNRASGKAAVDNQDD